MYFYNATYYANRETSLSQISVDNDFLPQLTKLCSRTISFKEAKTYCYLTLITSNLWRIVTSSFHPSFRLFYTYRNSLYFQYQNNLLLPWATCDLCFCYTPSYLGITANQLILVFPAICNELPAHPVPRIILSPRASITLTKSMSH